MCIGDGATSAKAFTNVCPVVFENLAAFGCLTVRLHCNALCFKSSVGVYVRELGLCVFFNPSYKCLQQFYHWDVLFSSWEKIFRFTLNTCCTSSAVVMLFVPWRWMSPLTYWESSLPASPIDGNQIFFFTVCTTSSLFVRHKRLGSLDMNGGSRWATGSPFVVCARTKPPATSKVSKVG